MTAEPMRTDAVDPEWKWLYRVGGISGLVLGMSYIIIFPLYARVGAPPSGGEAWLTYLVGKTTVWWVILWLSVITDLLFVPLAFALYLSLKEINRGAMLIATSFIGLFVTLDLAVTWSNYASLLILGGDYVAAANELQRAMYVAAASYPSAVLASPLHVVYAIVILSSGILFVGLVMLKGVFNKATAYVAIVTGILGIASMTRFSVVVIGNALLATVWVLLVGYRLYDLGQQ